MRSIWFSILFVSALVPSVLAQETGEAEISLQGEIPTVCEVEFGASTDATLDDLDLAAPGTETSDVLINCNVPLTGEVEAENGGFVNEDAAELEGGVNEIEYTLMLDFPALGIIGPFASDELLTPQAFDSGTTVLFESPGSLTLSWDSVDLPYAGTYSEIVRVSIEAVQ